MPHDSSPGRIEVITGPMFSGKSEELIRRLKRAQAARRRVLCFRPDLDLLFYRNAVGSHEAPLLNAHVVANTGELREALLPVIHDVEVIGIGEAHFFDASLVRLALELMRLNKRVIITGLDTTFAGDPFPPIPDLLAIADEILKLSAVCANCGAPAVHTQRVGDSHSLILVGAAGAYEARCRSCFQPYGDEEGTRQLKFPDIAGSVARVS